jgi:hypothetical protein
MADTMEAAAQAAYYAAALKVVKDNILTPIVRSPFSAFI